MKIIAANSSDAEKIAEIISLSNKDVAASFGINKDNNPKHPSFYTKEWALSDFERGEEYFICSENGVEIGCIAFEKSKSGRGYLNRLSVLPEYRNHGVGERLVQHVLAHAKSNNIPEISIGIIAKHTQLQAWYQKLGFTDNGLKEFPHLPFDVLFMKYVLA
jgi:ribosomal protein S18 acetylase RimI-like enzyme